MKILNSLLIFLLMLTACDEDSNCLKSTGKIVRKKRDVGYFSGIHVYDNIDLILSNTGPQSVEVEAGKNIQDGISMTIENFNLIIRNENKCNWLRSYDKKIKVFINQPDFFELFNLSHGQVSTSSPLVMDTLVVHNYGNGSLSMNIKCKKLRVDTNFFGDLDFTGEANEVWAHCFRLARLNTTNLKCQNFEMISDAEGDLSIYAENKLSGVIRNKGNVYYYGNPSVVTVQDNADGDFIKK